MRNRVRAYQAAARSIALADTQSVWINDDVLARAVHRFNRVFYGTFKRHGSNVPGPLEAQRRLSKRRMGVLSPFNSSAPSTEFGALFGVGYQPELQWKWEQPNPTPKLQQPMALEPSWSPPPPPPGPPHSSTVNVDLLEEPVEDTGLNDSDTLHKRLLGLQWPHRFAAVRETLIDFTGNTNVSPEASRTAFKFLINRFNHLPTTHKSTYRWERYKYFREDIMPFMLDPCVNHAEAGNLHLLLETLEKEPLPNKIYSSLLGLVFKLVETESIDLLSASAIFQWIEQLREKVDPTSADKKLQVNAKLAQLFKALWRAMARRTANDSESMASHAFQGFFDLITNSRFLIVSAPKLRERLIAEVSQRALPVPDYVQPNKVEEYLKDWTEGLDAQVTVPSPSGTYASGTDYIVYVLNSLSNEVVQERILVTTNTILAAEPSGDSKRSSWTAALRIWASCVVRSNAFIHAAENDTQCRHIVELLAPFVKPVALAFYLNRLDAREGARLLLQTWVKYRILDPVLRSSKFPIEPMNLHKYRGRLGKEGHHPNINKLLTSVHEPDPQHQSALDATFRSQQAILPATDEPPNEQVYSLISTKFEEYLSRHPPSLPSTSVMPYMDLIAAVSHTGLSYRSLMIEIFHLFLRFHRSVAPASGIYELYKTHGIRTLRGMAARLIDYYTTHDPIEALHIFRVIRTVGLGIIRRDFLIRIAEEGLLQPTFINRLIVSPNQLSSSFERVELLHEIADACAHSPHYRPVVAARFIHRLFVELRETGAPLDARLSRALVHAAVIRPLRDGDWASTGKFRGVLDAVRHIEGEPAAAKLDAMVWKWRGKVLWERRYEYRGVDDVVAFESRRHRLDAVFRRKRLARDRELIEQSRMGGDGDLDPYRFWKSVPEGEEVQNMRYFYIW